jgi:hypothetical protein
MGAEQKSGLKPVHAGRIQNSSSGSQLLTDLLGAVPVDLARIGEHIRSHAEITELVIRLARSLLLSADDGTTIEDAAVMLGTDRLRVVAYMWWVIEEYRGEDAAETPADLAAGAGDRFLGTYRIQGTNWTTQTLYLETFLRWLRLDSPDSELPGDGMEPTGTTWQVEDFADLKALLMRDFLALLPTLNPPSSKVDRANAASGANSVGEV